MAYRGVPNVRELSSFLCTAWPNVACLACPGPAWAAYPAHPHMPAITSVITIVVGVCVNENGAAQTADGGLNKLKSSCVPA